MDVDVEPISLRLEAPAEWHAQAADVLGQKLPVFWVKGAAAWYKLGEPHEEYRPFLRREVPPPPVLSGHVSSLPPY